ESGRPLGDGFKAAARACPGDEGALDAKASRISRPVRQFRSGLALPQAKAEATSAGPPGRRERAYGPPSRRILRRLVPAPAWGLGTQERGGAAAPSSWCSRTRSQDALDHGIQRAGRAGRARALS